MIRMEIACFLVVAFMTVLFCSAKRQKTTMDNTFLGMLIFSLIHMPVDALTVYTVNHLDTVSSFFNDMSHRIFISTMCVIFYLMFRYIVLLIQDELQIKKGRFIISSLILAIALVGSFLLPIQYVTNDVTNYSVGPAPYMTYFCVASYLLSSIFVFAKNYKHIQKKKRRVITVALGIVLIISVIQAFVPTALISGMGILLVDLAFYLTLENPDIALVEQIQREKEKADEANAAKSRFLSRMSHEIRTPMNAIIGVSEILLREPKDEEQKEYLETIKNSGKALVLLINDILDLSKIEAGKMELVEDDYEFKPMIHDVSNMIKNRIGEKPIQFVCDLDSKIPAILNGDGLRIRQILINLLNNAVKFTDGGSIKLSVNVGEILGDDVQLLFAVQDTGMGIKEEDLKSLFKSFSQVDTKKNKGKEGTGLGLAICAELVNMMGGSLTVESEYGMGSCFSFSIFQKIGVKKEIKTNEIIKFTAPNAHILLVDDNAMNRKIACNLLAPLKMKIDLAENGKKAIEKIENKKYDLIFMDHMMPVMDGLEATIQIRNKEGEYYNNVPIIALTANVMTEAQKEFLDAGMNGYVAKPIETDKISYILYKFLPNELIIPDEEDVIEKEKVNQKMMDDFNDLPGIDPKEGIKNCGSKELYLSLLGDFYKLIEIKAQKIERCLADDMIRDFTIEVHAQKNTARMIGALELSNDFAMLEQLGNKEDVHTIKEKTPDVLKRYRDFIPVLKKFGRVQNESRKVVSSEEILMYLQGLYDFANEFDMDMVDETMKKIDECYFDEKYDTILERLNAYVADVDIENIMKLAKELIDELKCTKE